MKSISIVWSLFLILSAVAVRGDECNCDEQVNAALQPVFNEKDALYQQLETARGELNGCANDKDALYQDVEQLRKSLEMTRGDAEYWQRTAGEHEGVAQEKHALVEEKTRHLEDKEVKISELEEELVKAQEEIKALSEHSVLKQLQKEIESLWNSIVQFFANLTAKKEQEAEL